jgi:peptidoglycan/LPS O-acetylase OafA/YrhL
LARSGNHRGTLRSPALAAGGSVSPELGNWGVQLFFALSGFLITARLLEEYDPRGQIRWTEFYLRRAFRILPAAFFAISVLAILGLGMHLIPMNLKQLLASVFFYRNYAASGWYTAHFWSLAVEEQFYLLWPAILCLVGVSRGMRAAAALGCAAAAWRLLDTHFDWIAHFQPQLRGDLHRTDYCIGQLFWGAAWPSCGDLNPRGANLDDSPATTGCRPSWRFRASC